MNTSRIPPETIDESFFFPRLKVFFPASVIRDKHREMKGGRESREGGRELGERMKEKERKRMRGGKRKEGKRREIDHGVHFKTDKDYKDLFDLVSE